MLDELLDGDDLQMVLPRQIDRARRGVARWPLVGQDLAKHARRLEPGHAGQVDRRLGMPGPAKHAAFFGDQRRDVARADEIARLAVGVDDGQDRGGPLLGGNARSARCDDPRER